VIKIEKVVDKESQILLRVSLVGWLFNFTDSVKEVEIDLTDANVWDDSAVGALDTIEEKFAQNGIKVKYIGLNSESKQLIQRIGGLSRAN